VSQRLVILLGWGGDDAGGTTPVEEGTEEGNTEKQEEGGDVGAVEGLTDSPLVGTGMVTMVGSDEGKVVSG